MTTVVTDPFPYSNGELASVSGGVYHQLTAGQALNVDTNAVEYAGTGSGEAVYIHTTSMGSADNWAQVAVTTGTGGYTETGPVWRQTAASGSTRTNYTAPLSGNGLQLYAVTSGTYTEIGSYATGTATGLVYGEAQGSAIKVFFDGVQRISVTNSAVTTGNFAGIEAYSSASVPALADTLTAGNFAGAAATSLIVPRRRQLFQRGLITR